MSNNSLICNFSFIFIYEIKDSEIFNEDEEDEEQEDNGSNSEEDSQEKDNNINKSEFDGVKK